MDLWSNQRDRGVFEDTNQEIQATDIAGGEAKGGGEWGELCRAFVRFDGCDSTKESLTLRGRGSVVFGFLSPASCDIGGHERRAGVFFWHHVFLGRNPASGS